MSASREPLCPFCGAYTPRSCDLREEMGGECAWIEMGNWDAGDDEDDGSDPDEECGRWDQSAPGGMSRQCRLAGTEFCDFDCPHSRGDRP